MNCFPQLPDLWICFSISFGIAIFTGQIMVILSKQFFTKDGGIRKFSILELEFPTFQKDIPNIIHGIYRLPDKKMLDKSLRNLKWNLYLDFIFMPAIYGSVFLLCMNVVRKFDSGWKVFFVTLAWIQLIAWLFDILENIYLLKNIKPEVKETNKAVFTMYRYMVISKWIFATFSGICSITVLIYFWMLGIFDKHNLKFAGLVLCEIALLLFIGLIISRKNKRKNKL